MVLLVYSLSILVPLGGANVNVPHMYFLIHLLSILKFSSAIHFKKHHLSSFNVLSHKVAEDVFVKL